MDKKTMQEITEWLEWRRAEFPPPDPKEEGISDFWYGVSCAGFGVVVLYLLSQFL